MKLLVGYFIFLFLIAMLGAAFVEDSQAIQSTERVVGLLQLSEHSDSVYAQALKGSVILGQVEVERRDGYITNAVFRRRSAGVPETTEELATLEIAYEEPAMIVYERSGNWFRVELPRESGWIDRSDAADSFAAYPELLAENLSYLREEWDGRLWSGPAATASLQPIPLEWRRVPSREFPIRVVEARRVGADLWLHVRIDAAESCSPQEERLPVIEGWLTAYQPSGKTSAWFYSRGC